jgi:protein-L-isoaspartate(D-aspartate) O-methyltransferase
MPTSQAGLVRLIQRQRLDDDRIVEAFRAVDRAAFVPSDARGSAYVDRPVGLPKGQTTSQPSLIARMIDAARVGPPDRVLEVGSGYGFQTALLAKLAGEVVSVELDESLAARAARNLEDAGLQGVMVVTGDGYAGVPEHAPYDAIIVSATAPEVPEALSEQLAEGGRLVIPLGDEVTLFEKTGGELRRVEVVTPARFVPLVPGE